MFVALSKWGRLIAVALLALTLHVGTPDAALARSNKGINDKYIEKDTSKSYVLPYALVILGVALGLVIVARPATRSEQARRRTEEDDDDE